MKLSIHRLGFYLASALRVLVTNIGQSLAGLLVIAGLGRLLTEDAEDLAAFQVRTAEPGLTQEQLLEILESRGEPRQPQG